MTKAEYELIYRQARKAYPGLTREAMTKIRQIYIDAANLVAAEVRKATLAGRSSLTIQSLEAIESQLKIGAANISNALNSIVPDTVGSAIVKTNNANSKYIIDAVAVAGASSKIKSVIVKEMFQGVNDDVIRSVVNRVYQDGYSFSSRVWRIGDQYQKTIKDVISAGIAQGRDPIKIAKDIQKYVSDGKIALANRYGPNLERGTKEFMKRIGNQVDWRALRLVRSELYAGLQDAALQQAKINPACNGTVDWVLEQNRQHWSCSCADIASAGPYKIVDTPSYPHPNCRCSISPVLIDNEQFNGDLKKWVNGEPVDYLDNWYGDHYARMVA